MPTDLGNRALLAPQAARGKPPSQISLAGDSLLRGGVGLGNRASQSFLKRMSIGITTTTATLTRMVSHRGGTTTVERDTHPQRAAHEQRINSMAEALAGANRSSLRPARGENQQRDRHTDEHGDEHFDVQHSDNTR